MNLSFNFKSVGVAIAIKNPISIIVRAPAEASLLIPVETAAPEELPEEPEAEAKPPLGFSSQEREPDDE